jgi:hypothetical protein
MDGRSASVNTQSPDLLLPDRRTEQTLRTWTDCSFSETMIGG